MKKRVLRSLIEVGALRKPTSKGVTITVNSSATVVTLSQNGNNVMLER